MSIDKIMEFFYIRTSNRVNEAVKKTGKSYEEIFPSDPKLISWITNNKRTKNNRYLICDAIIKDEDKNTDNGGSGLIVYCDFKNKKEVLWGTDTEIKEYLFELFVLLYKEYLTYDQLTAKLILSDYIPYAKYYAYNENISEYSELIKIYGMTKEKIENAMRSSESKAIEVLYSKCKYNFCKIFNEFADETNSYKKIPDIFKKNFFENRFISMLKEHIPDEYSLGLRVRNIIGSDLKQIAMSVKNVAGDTPLHELVSTSYYYINSLEKIQNEMIEIGKQLNKKYGNP